MSANIFISFASQDIKTASTLCKALESRGFGCWISARDILPGENFQSAIVQAIRRAKIMLLVFTANSNNSQEMTKELALASQQKLIVIPLRVEDVAPNDAFAYEFATRQWIDCFADWEFAMDQLSQRISNAIASQDALAAASAPAAVAEPALDVPAAEPASDAPVTLESQVEVAEVISFADLAAQGREAHAQAFAAAPEAPAASEAAPRKRFPLGLIAAGVAAAVAAAVVVPNLLHGKSSGGPALAAAAPAPRAAMVIVPNAEAPPPAQAPADAAPLQTMENMDPAAATPADAPPTPKRKARKAAAPKVDIPY